ncbi:MAG: hypothetical protein KDG51_11435, partial [Calditrichaeota bacterium]|nr:hypothetical protein [Calditrichota bacterium]
KMGRFIAHQFAPNNNVILFATEAQRTQSFDSLQFSGNSRQFSVNSVPLWLKPFCQLSKRFYNGI